MRPLLPADPRPDARPAPRGRPAHRRPPLAPGGGADPGRAARRAARRRQPADGRRHRGAARRDRGVPHRRAHAGASRSARCSPSCSPTSSTPRATPRGWATRAGATCWPPTTASCAASSSASAATRSRRSATAFLVDLRGRAVTRAALRAGDPRGASAPSGVEVRAAGCTPGECELDRRRRRRHGGPHRRARRARWRGAGEILAVGHRVRHRRRLGPGASTTAARTSCAACPASGRCSRLTAERGRELRCVRARDAGVDVEVPDLCRHIDGKARAPRGRAATAPRGGADARASEERAGARTRRPRASCGGRHACMYADPEAQPGGSPRLQGRGATTYQGGTAPMSRLSRLKPSGTGCWLVVASVLLALLVSPFALAAGEGNPLRAACATPARTRASRSRARPRSSPTPARTAPASPTSPTTAAARSTAAARRPAARATDNEPCIRANNLADGRAFEFETDGTARRHASRRATRRPAAPFTTNATGVATGLNADRVDGKNAEDTRDEAARRPQGADAVRRRQRRQHARPAAARARAGQRTAEGTYRVDFARRRHTCALHGDADGGENAGAISVVQLGGDKKTADRCARTRSPDRRRLALADRPFHLTVTC